MSWLKKLSRNLKCHVYTQGYLLFLFQCNVPEIFTGTYAVEHNKI